MLNPINFAALVEALLSRAHNLVPAWLPGGAQRGHEYVCASLYGGEGSSLSVNLNNGRWADFSTDEKGGDLVSLFAAVFGLDMGKAAVQVAREEGLEDVAGVARAVGDNTPRPERPPAPPATPKPIPSNEGWVTVLPVPAFAPAATFRHQYRLAQDIVHTAEYRVGDDLHGYVVRFKTSDGGKETLPHTWCNSVKAGAARWHWRQFDEPRPLFLPGHTLPGERTVILVEGEKKAEALQALLDSGAPGVYCVASWPGGCKAWQKADWAWLQGCTVLCWPDCDSKRERLTKPEQTALLAQFASNMALIENKVTEAEVECAKAAALAAAQDKRPLLPEHKQPGMAAMLSIGARLRDAHGCTVQLLPIPKPGLVPDGWDCGDAINTDGWDFERVMVLLGGAYALPLGEPGKAPVAQPDKPDAKKIETPGETEASDDAFADHLAFLCHELDCEVFELGVNRKLIIAALRKAPALQDCLGFNELTGTPCLQVPWPWRTEAGPLLDQDDLRLGDWLSAKYKIKAASRAALTEAVETVSDERRFHPIRDYLKASKHDGKSRIDKWLIHVLGFTPEEMAKKPKFKRYLELMGRFFLMGLVARVMEPGCKFDYSPVFEGKTGLGKSTLVEVLVGGKKYFSDTHFDIGNGKEGMEQLEGLWAYELSEMTAFRRADSESVKQFFSSRVDRFRGAYGRYVQQHPRQCVIVCTTNKRRYLFDLTGNRRFWPVWCDRPVNLEWLRKYRDLLFAEVFELFQKGEPISPTKEEELLYFEPEQRKRLAQTAVQSKLYQLLTRDGAPGGENKTTVDLNVHTKMVTLDRLVSALGADPAKSSSLLEGQIGAWMDAHGWQWKRSGKSVGGSRPYGYFQPAVWPPEDEEEDDEGDGAVRPESDGGGDDEPF